MNKKLVLTFASILLLVTLGYFGYQYFYKSDGDKAKETLAKSKELKSEKITAEGNFPVYYDMPVDKEWQISFDEPLAPPSVTKDTVYVIDEAGKVVAAVVSLTNNNQTVSIKAPQDGYSKGKYYELYMTDTIAYTDQETVSRSFKLGFFIARDKVKNIVFNKKMVSIEAKTIISDKKNVLVLEKNEESEELKEKDILKIPSNHDIYEEKAIKIIETNVENDEVHITYEQPKFMEIVQKVDIYDTFDLTTDEAIIVPNEGVQVEKFTSNEPPSTNNNNNNNNGEFHFNKASASSIEVGVNNGYEIAINKLGIEVDGEKLELSGKLKLSQPKTTWDVKADWNHIERLNAQIDFTRSTSLETKVNVPEKVAKEWIKKLKKRKMTNDKWLVTKEIPLAKIYVPIIPGVFIEGNILGQVGFNFLTGDAEIQVTQFISTQEETQFGIKKTKDGYDPIFHYDPELDTGFTLKGKAEGKAGAELSVGITALEVIGVNLDAEGGGYASGEGIATANSEVGIGACYKYEYGLLLGGAISVDMLAYNDAASFHFPELRVKINEKNSCEKIEEIIVTPDTLSAKPGDKHQVKVEGKYLDITTGKKLTKNLLVGDKFKKLNITSSDNESANVVIREGESNPESGKTKIDKDGMKITLKLDKKYKVFVNIPKEPISDVVKVTVKYDNQYTKEIPIKISGVEKPVSDAEAKKITSNVESGIIETFGRLGEKYNWSNLNNPADFKLLRPELLKYASRNFTDTKLKQLSKDLYCQCDAPFFPDTNLDVRFRIHQKTNKKMVVSSFEFINYMGNGGATVYYTIIKENGKWVLNNWEWVSAQKEPINVTWNEIKSFEKLMGVEVKLIRELTYKGRKAIIVYYPSDDMYKLIYRDDTDFIDDVPADLIQTAPSTSGVNGTYKDRTSDTDGTLNISNFTSKQFKFSMVVMNDRSAGEIDGIANYTGSKFTYTDTQSPCSLDFTIQGNTINIDETGDCHTYHGMGVYFQGNYTK